MEPVRKGLKVLAVGDLDVPVPAVVQDKLEKEMGQRHAGARDRELGGVSEVHLVSDVWLGSSVPLRVANLVKSTEVSNEKRNRQNPTRLDGSQR